MPGVPHLALKRPTGWTVPSARGLGDPDRSALDGGLVHLTWPAHPGVQELQRAGRPVGWIEEYDVQRGTWAALIDSSIVSDAASGEPLRCPGADAALALLRRAPGGAPHPLVERAGRRGRARWTVPAARGAPMDRPRGFRARRPRPPRPGHAESHRAVRTTHLHCAGFRTAPAKAGAVAAPRCPSGPSTTPGIC